MERPEKITDGKSCRKKKGEESEQWFNDVVQKGGGEKLQKKIPPCGRGGCRLGVKRLWGEMCASSGRELAQERLASGAISEERVS